MSFLRTYHREFVSAIVGASLAAVVSMATGLYSLTKSFEYTQNKEQLASLRKDIEFLTRVRAEIDINAQLLLSQDYRFEAKFGEPIDWVTELRHEKGKVPMSPLQAQAFRAMAGGKIVPFLELKAPREKLVVEFWGSSFPESGDIAFELLSDINDYYRRVRRINLTIERMDHINPSSGIVEGFYASLLKDFAYHNAQVDDMRKTDAVKLKNRITDEIQKLSERRKKISFSIDRAG